MGWDLSLYVCKFAEFKMKYWVWSIAQPPCLLSRTVPLSCKKRQEAFNFEKVSSIHCENTIDRS